MGEARKLKTAQDQAQALRKVAADILEEVERIARGLRPSVLDDLGLEAAVQRLARDFTTTHGIPVEVHVNGLQERLPAALESALYRIVQEALTNIAKHAAASQAWILMRNTTEGIQVIIEDNGCGFDVETALHAVNGREPLGLHGIQERARLLNGTLTIESSPGNGTALFVYIPLSPTH
jgi:signal transduction histidine kinase